MRIKGGTTSSIRPDEMRRDERGEERRWEGSVNGSGGFCNKTDILWYQEWGSTLQQIV